MSAMQRGEVWWVDFEPAVGGEVKKQRPAVIISNDAANRHLNRLQVVPLTSNVEHIYPSEAAVIVNGKPGKAMADQLTTVSKLRVKEKLGTLPPDDMRRVERAVKLQLGLLELSG
jgi:mRNA interferase MazF